MILGPYSSLRGRLNSLDLIPLRNRCIGSREIIKVSYLSQTFLNPVRPSYCKSWLGTISSSSSFSFSSESKGIFSLDAPIVSSSRNCPALTSGGGSLACSVCCLSPPVRMMFRLSVYSRMKRTVKGKRVGQESPDRST